MVGAKFMVVPIPPPVSPLFKASTAGKPKPWTASRVRTNSPGSSRVGIISPSPWPPTKPPSCIAWIFGILKRTMSSKSFPLQLPSRPALTLQLTPGILILLRTSITGFKILAKTLTAAVITSPRGPMICSSTQVQTAWKAFVKTWKTSRNVSKALSKPCTIGSKIFLLTKSNIACKPSPIGLKILSLTHTKTASKASTIICQAAVRFSMILSHILVTNSQNLRQMLIAFLVLSTMNWPASLPSRCCSRSMTWKISELDAFKPSPTASPNLPACSTRASPENSRLISSAISRIASKMPTIIASPISGRAFTIAGITFVTKPAIKFTEAMTSLGSRVINPWTNASTKAGISSTRPTIRSGSISERARIALGSSKRNMSISCFMIVGSDSKRLVIPSVIRPIKASPNFPSVAIIFGPSSVNLSRKSAAPLSRSGIAAIAVIKPAAAVNPNCAAAPVRASPIPSSPKPSPIPPACWSKSPSSPARFNESSRSLSRLAWSLSLFSFSLSFFSCSSRKSISAWAFFLICSPNPLRLFSWSAVRLPNLMTCLTRLSSSSAACLFSSRLAFATWPVVLSRSSSLCLACAAKSLKASPLIFLSSSWAKKSWPLASTSPLISFLPCPALPNCSWISFRAFWAPLTFIDAFSNSLPNMLVVSVAVSRPTIPLARAAWASSCSFLSLAVFSAAMFAAAV